MGNPAVGNVIFLSVVHVRAVVKKLLLTISEEKRARAEEMEKKKQKKVFKGGDGEG
jgi:hypothetical protein